MTRPNNTKDLVLHTPLINLIGGKRLFRRAYTRQVDPPPIKRPPPRLATETAAKGKAHTNSPAYHAPDGTARHLDGVIEIENRANRRDREARRRAFGFTAGRVHDLVTCFAFTYGDAMPDDDAGRDDFFILAQHAAGLNGNPVRHIVRYADRWCPWMGDDELAATIRRVLARPYRWGADTLGEKIGLIDAVRTKLRITTIGAIDVPKAHREQRRRERWNAKRRKRTREQYLAASLTKAEPWKAEGVGRATWYRRRETEPPKTDPP